MPKTLLIVVNDPAFFLAQHLHIADAARANGFDVHLASPEWPGAAEIRDLGYAFHPFRLSRGSISPMRELETVRDLIALYRTVRPDLVYHITLKTILYGTLAARLADVPAVVNANTGLGYTFIDESRKTAVMRRVMMTLYRMWVRHENRCDLFLNPDDQNDFIGLGIADAKSSKVIKGPGVDLDQFTPAPEPKGLPVVVLASRMLWHKGIAEFVEAARMLKARGVQARFALVGDDDPGNLATVSRAQLEAWAEEGCVEWWGYRHDMPEVFQQAHIGVLPSYREGLGKVLIEAAACGRPVIASDVPGCREAVREGVNGFRVPVRNAEALADAMARLIKSPGLRRRFGINGRKLVEAEFGNETISSQTLDVCFDLLESKTPALVTNIHPLNETVKLRKVGARRPERVFLGV